MKKKSDLLLIAAILAVALALSGYLYFTKEKGAMAVVMVDGKDVASYPLNKEITEKIETEDGFNVLVIKDGKADVTVADCLDGICCHEAAIMYDGQSIICLPHKLVVEIRGGEKPDLDGVVK